MPSGQAKCFESINACLQACSLRSPNLSQVAMVSGFESVRACVPPNAHTYMYTCAHMQAGHIINVSSVLGRLPFPTYRSTYCARRVPPITPSIHKWRSRSSHPRCIKSILTLHLYPTRGSKHALNSITTSVRLEVSQAWAGVLSSQTRGIQSITPPPPRPAAGVLSSQQKQGAVSQSIPYSLLPSPHTRARQANNAGLQGKLHVSSVSPGLINTEFGTNVVRFTHAIDPIQSHGGKTTDTPSIYWYKDRGGPRRPQPVRGAARGGGVRRHTGRDPGACVCRH